MPSDWKSRAATHLLHATRAVVDLVYPPSCLACRCELPSSAAEVLLCRLCHDSLAPPQAEVCPHCALALRVRREALVATGDVPPRCPVCAASEWSFREVIALGQYEGALREAVLKTKHAENQPLARALAELLWKREAARLTALKVDAVVAIPTHWWRRLQRRASGPETIATLLAARLHIPLDRGLLRCRKLHARQAQFRPAQRVRNVRGVFALGWGYRLDGARLLLVDDVLTSGATCSAAARVLTRAGAEVVSVAVLARARG